MINRKIALNNKDDLIELDINNDHDLDLEDINPDVLITTESGSVLSDGSTINLNADTNSYNLELVETFNPGPPPEGRDYESLRNKP